MAAQLQTVEASMVAMVESARSAGCMMSSPSLSPSRHITVVDVYDLAAAIGKDFERLIDQFGAESVRTLMPKVISSLETLESLASSNERENEEIVSLKKMVDRLESEKQAKMEGKVKFERELEQVEENYRKEIDDLWSMVKSLQNENKQLSASLSDQEPSSPISTGRDEDIKVMVGLRDQTEKHKDQIKQLQRELIDKATELENWQSDVERLTRQNKELQRKSKAIQNQGRVLVEEKSELICQLQAREEQLIGLQHRLAETDRARKDYEQIQQNPSSASTDRQLSDLAPPNIAPALSPTQPAFPLRQGAARAAANDPRLAEERDKDDRDNTPRFTLAELREVLQEKNSLKARVMELEEELEQLRPHSNLSADKSPAVDEELLVYGPINREPEEKLFPWKYQRKDSGVRKFFSWGFGRRRDGAGHSDLSACSSSPSASSSRTAAAGQTVRFRREGTPYEEEEMTGSITTTTGRTSGEAEQPIEFALDVAPGASSSSSASAAGGPRRSSIRSWLPKISHTPDGKL